MNGRVVGYKMHPDTPFVGDPPVPQSPDGTTPIMPLYDTFTIEVRATRGSYEHGALLQKMQYGTEFHVNA
jgi:hypothetical protein